MAEPEYIDDRALESREGDRFHHAELADQLTEFILHERTPLHVAVYGPWGSGKSSLGRFLKNAISAKAKGVRFVLFNAWKFAREPLQRQFISQVAKELGLRDERFSRGLYQRRRVTKLNLRITELGKLILVFWLLLLAVAAMVLVAAWGLAYLNEQTFTVVLGELLRRSIAPAVLSASFITGVLALVGKLFSVDVEEYEPSSEERFEQLFADMVQKVKGKGAPRVVFFIDEVDRCSPTEVVAVLETIRTFLDIEGCVFVVAADQQVLEKALTEAVRHSVPEDTDRPYYSSGSEYLDKVFQHQVVIPPLYSQKLTNFALELVQGRKGVWSEVADLETLVSVLIPSHVVSPRRAKVLLNSFVTLYRFLKARHQIEPLTTPDPDLRILEVAKLSTLRLEFPRFYRHMERHPRLAAHLTAYIENEAWPGEIEMQAQVHGTADLVEEYADLKRPTDFILTRRESDHD